MTYQPKINNTQKYDDSQGKHVVCRGKLVLLPFSQKLNNKIFVYDDDEHQINPVHPIIISETEEIEVGDWVYNLSQDNVFKLTEHLKDELDLEFVKYTKVLALPEHFSDKHLQAIVDGKMEDRDEVLVKCEEGNYNYRCFDESQFEFFVHLDQQNYITLFPAKQSLEEAANQWVSEVSYSTDTLLERGNRKQAFKAGAEWAKKNNY